MMKKLSTKQLISWAEHISMLLRSGIPLSQVFEFMIETGSTRRHANQAKLKMNRDILEAITHGKSLALALESSTYAIPPIFIHLIRIGESSGSLAAALGRTVSYFRMKEEIQQKIIGAMTYPALIACATCGIAGFLVAFIFPKIMPLFISMHVELPLPTRILLGASTFMGNYWAYIVSSSALLIFVAIFSYKRFRTVCLGVETFLLWLPLSRDMFQNRSAAHIFDVISMQLQCGISLPQALSQTAQSTTSVRYSELLVMAAEQVSQGKSFGEELKKYPQLFSVDTVGLLLIAEQTGDIGTSCDFLSGIARENIDRSINTLSKLIEPVLMLGMGIVVGSIALSIIMPIYEITNRINMH